MRITRPGAIAIAAAFLMSGQAPAASDEERRVVVADFEGPVPSVKLAQDAVVDIIDDFYEVLPYAKYRVAQRRLEVSDNSTKSIAAIARRLGVDAIIEGKIEGRTLTISVREGKTGRVFERFAVPVQARGLSAAVRERLTDELIDVITWTEPLAGTTEVTAIERTEEALRNPADDEAPAPPASEKKPVAVAKKKWSADDDPAAGARARRRASAIQMRAAVGVAATSRQLVFSHQVDLAEEARPLGMTGSPSPGVAVGATFDVVPLGVSADVAYERSIGASVSYPSQGDTKQLGMSLSHIGVRLAARRALNRRLTLRGGVGYQQRSFSVSNRPVGLHLFDSRYAFLDLGAGARFNLRDDRLALTADLSYLYVINASGITDASAYGSSRFQGFGGVIAIEIEAGDNNFVRVAGNYERLTLAFNGDGMLSTNLDGAPDVDVSGATDTFIGGVVMFGFHL